MDAKEKLETYFPQDICEAIDARIRELIAEDRAGKPRGAAGRDFDLPPKPISAATPSDAETVTPDVGPNSGECFTCKWTNEPVSGQHCQPCRKSNVTPYGPNNWEPLPVSPAPGMPEWLMIQMSQIGECRIDSRDIPDAFWPYRSVYVRRDLADAKPASDAGLRGKIEAVLKDHEVVGSWERLKRNIRAALDGGK